jgi:hypothetical protein
MVSFQLRHRRLDLQRSAQRFQLSAGGRKNGCLRPIIEPGEEDVSDVSSVRPGFTLR